MRTLRKVVSGVPQGSVLGPLLFVIFINDLPGDLSNKCKLFADDLKLIVDASNIFSINKDINALEKWESLWLLRFNREKCKVMQLNYHDNPKNEYTFNGVKLEAIDTEKDLGVINISSLSWNDHIKQCISKSNQMITWVTRCFISREKGLMNRIYKTIIRPYLEYASQLWSPMITGVSFWS